MSNDPWGGQALGGRVSYQGLVAATGSGWKAVFGPVVVREWEEPVKQPPPSEVHIPVVAWAMYGGSMVGLVPYESAVFCAPDAATFEGYVYEP